MQPSTMPEEQAPSTWYQPLVQRIREWWPQNSTLPANLVLKTVNRGRFRITVNEKGYLRSQRNETLTSQVPGSTTIIKIVPEGTHVKEGDIVCELDSSSYEENARQQEINLTKAEANFSAAKENLEIQKNQNDSDIAIAQLKYELAKLDLQKYKEGELPQQLDSILGQIRLKEEQLARKRESYEFTKRMAKKGYRSLSDLEAERISVTQSEIELKVEQDKLRVLENFTSKRDIALLESDAVELEREKERTDRKTSAALSKAQAEFESARLTLHVEREKYQEWLRRIENCTLRAAQSGEVVYANENSSSRRGSSEPEIFEGATVRERQAIIHIPDNELMMIDAKIHESMISRVKQGQTVFVRLDAQPGEVFNGVVSEISSVPLSGSWPNYDVKEYQVAINLIDGPEKISKLRAGNSADFEIVVNDRDDVLLTPVQSVVQVGRQFYVWIVQGQRVARRQVTIGLSNETDIEILDGLDVGELVVMNPRSQFGDEITKLEESSTPTRITNTANEQGPLNAIPETAADSAPGNRGRGAGPAPAGTERRPEGGAPRGNGAPTGGPGTPRGEGRGGRPPAQAS
ncbi:MAG: efflux RND transporter periplasmic adaptor subunit [Planctomycetaceae bacterium]|nr:efflux RND transporter periplasmic adaptor subunit [Planctomycetaceae bacterium]